MFPLPPICHSWSSGSSRPGLGKLFCLGKLQAIRGGAVQTQGVLDSSQQPASVGGSPAEAGVAVSYREDKDTGSRSSGKYSLE